MSDDLTPTTKAFWDLLPYRFKRGAVMGPQEIGELTRYSPNGAYYHLIKLCIVGRVERIQQGRRRGLYRGKTHE